jgi:dUTP pyrophosphatase
MNYKKVLEDIKKLGEFMPEMENEEIDYSMLFQEYGVDVKSLEEEMLNYSPKMELGFVKLNPETIEPMYNYEGDSGFDLYSTEEIVIEAFGRALIPTGLAFDIKDGYEIQVRSKSGLAINQGLFVLNSPGTVDSGYLGEVKVILFNTNKESVTIKKGMKVGQAVLSPVVNGKWVELVKKDKIDKKDRGDKGFGSTGI